VGARGFGPALSTENQGRGRTSSRPRGGPAGSAAGLTEPDLAVSNGSPDRAITRLCGGQILVAHRVLALDDLVDAEPLGELALKGFLRPVPVFSVTGLR
jgi:hypothetical protein